MINIAAMELQYGYVVSIVPVTWKDTLVGMEREIVSYDFAKQFADACLNNGQYSDLFVELLEVNHFHDAVKHVEALASTEAEHDVMDIAHSKEKWLLAILTWVYENQGSFDDPLGVVEELYAKFEYPKDIENFVRYMPTTLPDLGSKQRNEERLILFWHEYIQSKKLEYQNAG